MIDETKKFGASDIDQLTWNALIEVENDLKYYCYKKNEFNALYN